MAVIAVAVLSIYFVLNSATVLYCIWSWLRSPKISAQEQRRANMRSCSWPTTDGDTFAPSSPQSKAKPTLVNGQVSD